MTIPIHISGIGPAKDEECQVFHQRCVEHRLPWITVERDTSGYDMLQHCLTVTIDYGLVFLGCMERRYGKNAFVWHNPSAAYYALMGRLMAYLSKRFGQPHGHFQIGYDDSPTFTLSFLAFADMDPDWMTDVATAAEETLPEIRRMIDEALPGIPCSIDRFETTAA